MNNARVAAAVPDQGGRTRRFKDGATARVRADASSRDASATLQVPADRGAGAVAQHSLVAILCRSRRWTIRTAAGPSRRRGALHRTHGAPNEEPIVSWWAPAPASPCTTLAAAITQPGRVSGAQRGRSGSRRGVAAITERLWWRALLSSCRRHASDQSFDELNEMRVEVVRSSRRAGSTRRRFDAWHFFAAQQTRSLRSEAHVGCLSSPSLCEVPSREGV